MFSILIFGQSLHNKKFCIIIIPSLKAKIVNSTDYLFVTNIVTAIYWIYNMNKA
jgi:hypothetical protein